jgi:DNA-binding SARP family transcriptional activator/tetratricopeptide (TPR) repeat protein
VEFVLFGHVRATHQGQPVELGRRQERCLLGLLLIEAGRVVSPDRLAELLWDGSPPSRARGVVQTYVARLRRQLAPSGVAIASNSGGYCAEVAAEDVDLHRFQLAVTAARQAGDPGQRADLLAAALELWHGPVLGSVASDQLRARVGSVYEEMRLAAIEQCAEAYLRSGSPDRAVLVLATAGDDHPVREETVALRMTALAAAGRKAESLAAYRSARLRLRQELGLEPGRELRLLHERILRSDHRLDFAGPAEQPPPPAPGPGVAARRPVPRQLPPDLEVFAGRQDVLKELDGLRPGGPGRGRDGGPGVVVVHGTAGVGKTSLVVHWAHQVRDRFSDGQLYVNLHGYGPGPALASGQVLRGFLDALGMTARHIPAGEPDQAGLYRSLVADKHLLIILDNAADCEQVRPLLPGGGGCLVAVTSRHQLAGLVTAEGAHSVTLGLPSADEARALLARRLGEERLAAEPQATGKIIQECARLPLALAIVAARAAVSPGFPLAALAAQLSDGQGSLDTFATGDPGSELRTVFSWSYRALTAGAARMFRMLGLHPGPEISAAAAASAAGLPVRQAGPLLAELTRAHLIEEAAPGRYTTHDLLSAYAAELVGRHDPAGQRQAATRRLLDHYLHTAYAANHLIRSPGDPAGLAPAQAGVTVGKLASLGEALGWLAAEHQVLPGMVEEAAGMGLPAHASQLAWSLTAFLDRQGRPLDMIEVQRTALAAAQKAADRPGQSRAHHGLALAYLEMGRLDESVRQLWSALDLAAGLGDLAGQARAHTSIAFVRGQQGHLADAVVHAERALGLYREAGFPGGQARALNNAGWAYAQAGDHRRALEYCQEGLGLLTGLGDQQGQAVTLDSLGYVHEKLGDHRRAVECYGSAAALGRETGGRAVEAQALLHMGDNYCAIGDQDAARTAWRSAQVILDDLDHPDAHEARARLDGQRP